MLTQYQDVLSRRPTKTNLPHFLTELGQSRLSFARFWFLSDINAIAMVFVDALVTTSCGFVIGIKPVARRLIFKLLTYQKQKWPSRLYQPLSR